MYSIGVRCIEPEDGGLRVTLQCPGCGREFTVRANRLSMTTEAT